MMTAIGLVMRGAANPFPGAPMDALVGVVVIAALTWWWFRALRRRRDLAASTVAVVAVM
jgi:hypothetical protein